MFIKIFKFKLLNQIFIFLICFVTVYTILNKTKMETEGVTKVKIIVQAPCNILSYANEFYSFISFLKKKGILVSNSEEFICTDYSLFKYHFIFKTGYFDYVNNKLREIIHLNLENKEFIKNEIKDTIRYNEIKKKDFNYALKILKDEISNYNLRNNEIDVLEKRTLNKLIEEYNSLTKHLQKIELEIYQFEKLLKSNVANYKIDYTEVDKRITLGLFNNLFIISFFISILLYFFIILFETVLLKKNLD